MFKFWDSFKWYFVIAFVISAAGAGYVYGYGAGKDKEHLASIKAVEAQKAASEKECRQAQQITMDVDNGLQKDLSDINGRLTSGLMLNSSCIMPQANPAGRSTSSTGTSGPGHAGTNGIRSEWLRHYAAVANTYRAKYARCQELLIKERQ